MTVSAHSLPVSVTTLKAAIYVRTALSSMTAFLRQSLYLKVQKSRVPLAVNGSCLDAAFSSQMYAVITRTYLPTAVPAVVQQRHELTTRA